MDLAFNQVANLGLLGLIPLPSLGYLGFDRFYPLAYQFCPAPGTTAQPSFCLLDKLLQADTGNRVARMVKGSYMYAMS
jgi:hypothetical protein